MAATGDERERWHFADRYYGVTMASTPTSMDLELDDLGPGLALGLVAMVFYDDDSGEMTFKVFTEDAVPLALVEQFVSEARRRPPPVA